MRNLIILDEERARCFYDARSKMQEFNKRFFSDEIDLSNISFVWRATKNRYGQATYWWMSGRAQIQLSDLYKCDEKDLDNTLIHELIHVWEFQKIRKQYISQGRPLTNVGRVGHGRTFHDKANEINSSSDYKITERESIQPFELQREYKIRKYALVAQGKRGVIFANISKNFNIENIKTFVFYYFERGIITSADVWLTLSPMIEKLTQNRRDLRNSYTLPSDQAQELIDDIKRNSLRLEFSANESNWKEQREKERVIKFSY